ncbi:hypothetical protein C2G38_635935 [Gigaspora rosea]|uniref:C2H2-type domain-containing protein n=1 Tax=Gigaspora rosea TaxID=44941 RepID=A0A397U5Q4_9GLOM|nr:hypothetical protein C2G38_635935 [Gigaspora rosea]
MTLTCKPCKKEFKTSQGYGNHIKSLAHKLNPLHEISNNNLLSNNNHIPKQIQFNNEQENFMDIYSTSNENECSNSDSLHNSLSNERITTDDEELKSNSSKNYTDEDNYNYANEDNYNCINEDDSNYEELISEIPNELKIPNNAFIDFMNVVDKYNISNKAGDAFLKVFKKYSSLDQNLLPKSTSAGRHYLRSINIFTLQFKKDLVSTYNNTNYYFENRSILLAIQELLQNDDLMQQCEFNYKEQWKVDENNQRVQCYAEIYNANWWKKTEQNLPFSSKLLALILYSDGTTCDVLGKTSCHPLFITLGNIPKDVIKKMQKLLLDYFQ